MHKFIELAKEEMPQLEYAIKKIDSFLNKAPEGCLKRQNKNGKTYYYHQFMQENKWKRRYIKKSDLSLAKMLAQKHYYIAIKPILEKTINELKRLAKKCSTNELEEIYDNLSVERKSLVTPIQMSVQEKLTEWQSEICEKNTMYPENLRYETEQGDVVRSKSEVIIANILYQNREHILYKYERSLEIVENGRKKTIYPDFTIINKYTGKITYWEHAGRMDDPYYANDFVKKINAYVRNDLLPGRDVVITYETQNIPLDIKVVKQLVEEVVCFTY